jgi:hypothetical protein
MALNALEKALTDLRRRHGELYANVGAGVMWAAVLDENLRDDLGAEYEELRDREAPLLHGLVHARNGVMHAALVTTNAGGITAPIVAPIVIGPPSWRSSVVLHKLWTPKALESARVRKRVAMYEEHLAGRDPADTFEEVLGFFRSLEAVGWKPSTLYRA